MIKQTVYLTFLNMERYYISYAIQFIW